MSVLQEKLETLGFDPGAVEDAFGVATTVALLAFQKGADLLADGIAGSETLGALALTTTPVDRRAEETMLLTLNMVAQMLTLATPRAKTGTHLLMSWMGCAMCGPGDGGHDKGRGFLQLSGRINNQQIGQQITVPLKAEPERANQQAFAALILATVLSNQER